MHPRKWVSASIALFFATFLFGCTPSPPSQSAIHAASAELSAVVIRAPRGWTPQAYTIPGDASSRGDCIAKAQQGLNPSGWLASRTVSWRNTPTISGPHKELGANLNVCLSRYASLAEARDVQNQLKNLVTVWEATPASTKPGSIVVPGVPGAVGSTINVVGAGLYDDVYLTKGNMVCWVDAICYGYKTYGLCSIALSTAQQLFHSLPT